MATIVTQTATVEAKDGTTSNATIAKGTFAYTCTVSWNRYDVILAADADDTAVELGSLSAIRLASIKADQNLTVKIGADTAVAIYIPSGMIWTFQANTDVTALYLSNLNASTAANVEILLAK